MKYYTKVGDSEHTFTFSRDGDHLLARTVDRTYRLDLAMVGDGSAFSLLVDDRSYDLIVEPGKGKVNVLVKGHVVQVHVEDERERIANAVAAARPQGKRTTTSSMPGVVVEILVAVGDVVEDGQTMLVLEAMKMQNPILAEGAGTVTRIHVAAGEAIGAGAVLVDLDA